MSGMSARNENPVTGDGHVQPRATRAVLRKSAQNSSLMAGVLVVALVLTGMLAVDGFGSGTNLKTMLVFGAFLGIVSIGQTLCALLGELDLSIPFVVGAANIVMLWLLGQGLSSWSSVLIVVALALVVGTVTGLISYFQPGRSLILSLGMGFAVLGGAQIVVSVGADQAGTVYGRVPGWLTDAGSANGSFLGTGVGLTVWLWAALAVVVILVLRRTWPGRGLYAMGGNRTAAERALVPQLGIWLGTFALSAAMASVVGILLLGFSGGAFADVGRPYLFTTVAAVVVGGTSLLGGRGGYGATVLGVAVMTLLGTVLVGLGLSAAAQQAVLGLLIVPMVALYGRQPHPRTQI
ncbi:ABC transporter permease [Streptomyces acidiscabies]|uniref:Autoinducer 2 import system permease protein LsrC n=1 Tax=Streptomyces acidiscabies TaxID=42234 RepID=A0AAP6BLN7_9ACTN|nr:ABC transporter permease [Streptomyces acidiscabies]MBP5935732.1 ABC transporter permease [Streptomyces sp. LBUM 1476]MBZ3916373.1 ABC transporter permease [Streptomyces acidiscabies]MDX2967047.1 ABC transporter permease [Streptomyces acidiscabies]MDX3022792.1 ABC transporter permease [Streptomyces acidiscabies]MDX3796924.1 ABC transporter permease [Streptomyces acidiscabies]